MANTDRVGKSTWVGIARETFERGMAPWVGRKHESWLRSWARPHLVDPGQILIPERMYSIYATHRVMQPIIQLELQAMGYPKLPSAEDGNPEGLQRSVQPLGDEAPRLLSPAA